MSHKGDSKENVLKYLADQNRPYSANDIILNLHGEFGKTAVQKALDDLVCENKIREKIYGKQKVYSVIQEDESKGSELDALDKKIEETSDKLKTSEQELKRMEILLKQLNDLPTDEDAEKQKEELESSVKELTDKLKLLSESTIRISEEEKNEIVNDRNRFTNESKKRKQICMDIINSIMEHYPKKLQELLEDIGVDLDAETL